MPWRLHITRVYMHTYIKLPTIPSDLARTQIAIMIMIVMVSVIHTHIHTLCISIAIHPSTRPFTHPECRRANRGYRTFIHVHVCMYEI